LPVPVHDLGDIAVRVVGVGIGGYRGAGAADYGGGVAAQQRGGSGAGGLEGVPRGDFQSSGGSKGLALEAVEAIVFVGNGGCSVLSRLPYGQAAQLAYIRRGLVLAIQVVIGISHTAQGVRTVYVVGKERLGEVNTVLFIVRVVALQNARVIAAAVLSTFGVPDQLSLGIVIVEVQAAAFGGFHRVDGTDGGINEEMICKNAIL